MKQPHATHKQPTSTSNHTPEPAAAPPDDSHLALGTHVLCAPALRPPHPRAPHRRLTLSTLPDDVLVSISQHILTATSSSPSCTTPTSFPISFPPSSSASAQVITRRALAASGTAYAVALSVTSRHFLVIGHLAFGHLFSVIHPRPSLSPFHHENLSLTPNAPSAAGTAWMRVLSLAPVLAQRHLKQVHLPPGTPTSAVAHVLTGVARLCPRCRVVSLSGTFDVDDDDDVALLVTPARRARNVKELVVTAPSPRFVKNVLRDGGFPKLHCLALHDAGRDALAQLTAFVRAGHANLSELVVSFTPSEPDNGSTQETERKTDKLAVQHLVTAVSKHHGTSMPCLRSVIVIAQNVVHPDLDFDAASRLVQILQPGMPADTPCRHVPVTLCLDTLLSAPLPLSAHLDTVLRSATDLDVTPAAESSWRLASAAVRAALLRRATAVQRVRLRLGRCDDGVATMVRALLKLVPAACTLEVPAQCAGDLASLFRDAAERVEDREEDESTQGYASNASENENENEGTKKEEEGETTSQCRYVRLTAGRDERFTPADVCHIAMSLAVAVAGGIPRLAAVDVDTLRRQRKESTDGGQEEESEKKKQENADKERAGLEKAARCLDAAMHRSGVDLCYVADELRRWAAD